MFQSGGVIKMQTGNTFKPQLTFNNQFDPNNYQNYYGFNVNNNVDISLKGVTSAAARQSRSN